MNLYKNISREDYIKLQETRTQDGGNNELAPWAVAFLEKYSKYIQEPILDVGCASGALVKHFRETLQMSSMGVDIVDEAVVKGISQGTPIVSHDIHRNFPFPDKCFNTVTMFHTLEHTLDPKLVLRNIHRILDGNICVILPLGDFSTGDTRDTHDAHTANIPNVKSLEKCFEDYNILVSDSSGPWNGHLIIASTIK